jgi:hypothetical protein
MSRLAGFGGAGMQPRKMCLVMAVALGAIVPAACGSGGTSQSGQTPTTAPPTTIPSATPTTPPPSTPSATKANPVVGPEKKSLANATFSRSTVIDNKWFPLRPGMQYIYEGVTIEDGERIPHRLVLTVTDFTKEIGGVRNVVMWDRDFAAGVLEEAELAFFAQDDDGKLWHFGEYPEVYENGKRVEAPSWIHGIQGAAAGITVKPDAKLGDSSFAQGWGPAVAWSDRARVYRSGQKTCVKAGCYNNVLIMDEFSFDEPGAHQLKYYAPGVGLVRVGWYGNDPTKETLELVRIVQASPETMAFIQQQALRLERSAYNVSKNVYALTKPMERPE